ncbi:hypothetical protein [Arthrobacter sp. A2-55]|uniref:hypothetical protein n=1 Tax=Arthrobacter sp. A2-55 TaxID=2897337 RepID=UPI0021CDCDB0|nr:hypothetical protein [Arthrobacter sp. A2-55]MCU6480520.1 hypothetical protein [Arthrobacter sp. A2-55]
MNIPTAVPESVSDPRVEAAALAIDPAPWRSGHPASLARQDAIRETATAALAASDEVMFAAQRIDRAVSTLAQQQNIVDIFTNFELALALRVEVVTVLSSLTGRDLISMEAKRNPEFASWVANE